MHDIIIAGAGPAGMTAALYALRAGKTVQIFEKESIGGQIAYASCVENFPSVRQTSGSEFADNLLSQILDLGADLALSEVTGIREDGGRKLVLTADGNHSCRAVILATGVKHRPLGLPGESAFIGRGLSFCAICDGAFYQDQTVAVVGGGSAALEDALFLSNICKKVFLIHRRAAFRAEHAAIRAVASKENIEPILDTVVTQYIGEDRLSAIALQNVNDGRTDTLMIDGLFLSIGRVPANEAFADIAALSADGYFQASETCVLVEGVYAAGDCRQKPFRQLTTAVSDGTCAALAACQYIDSLPAVAWMGPTEGDVRVLRIFP